MPSQIRQLKFSDFIFRRNGSFVFRLLLAAFGSALKLFFRRIETANAERVPKSGGLIFVLNHPNGLIDPALVFVALPRRISFLAKSTLFRTPVISSILKTVEALPVYRKMDSGEDVSNNQATFTSARERLRQGGSIALFPEGVSHNSPNLLPLKTGAARIALGAAADEDGIDAQIVPVGLFYTNKTTFRSEALLHFGEPFPVPHVELDEDGQPPRNAVRELTEQIRAALVSVTANAETDAEMRTARIAEEIVTATADSANLGDRLDLIRSYLRAEPTGIARADGRQLAERLLEFDQKLEKRGLEPIHLSLSQFPKSFVVKEAVKLSWPLILLTPLAAVGALLHFPAYQLCKFLAHRFTHHGADDVASTVKVLAAMVFMPLTWIAAAGVVFYFAGWQAALASLPVSFLLGWIALYTLEGWSELGSWARAVVLYLAEKESFLRLFVERQKLTDELRGLNVGGAK